MLPCQPCNQRLIFPSLEVFIILAMIAYVNQMLHPPPSQRPKFVLRGQALGRFTVRHGQLALLFCPDREAGQAVASCQYLDENCGCTWMGAPVLADICVPMSLAALVFATPKFSSHAVRSGWRTAVVRRIRQQFKDSTCHNSIDQHRQVIGSFWIFFFNSHFSKNVTCHCRSPVRDPWNHV